MSGQNELFKKLYGRPVSDVSQQEMFDELYKRVPPGEYTATLKKLADVASERTRELREVSDKAHLAYCKAKHAYDLRWREAWAQARAEMVQRGTDAES